MLLFSCTDQPSQKEVNQMMQAVTDQTAERLAVLQDGLVPLNLQSQLARLSRIFPKASIPTYNAARARKVKDRLKGLLGVGTDLCPWPSEVTDSVVAVLRPEVLIQALDSALGEFVNPSTEMTSEQALQSALFAIQQRVEGVLLVPEGIRIEIDIQFDNPRYREAARPIPESLVKLLMRRRDRETMVRLPEYRVFPAVLGSWSEGETVNRFLNRISTLNETDPHLIAPEPLDAFSVLCILLTHVEQVQRMGAKILCPATLYSANGDEVTSKVVCFDVEAGVIRVSYAGVVDQDPAARIAVCFFPAASSSLTPVPNGVGDFYFSSCRLRIELSSTSLFYLTCWLFSTIHLA